MPSPGEKNRTTNKADKKRKATSSPKNLVEKSPEMASLTTSLTTGASNTNKTSLSMPGKDIISTTEEDYPAWVKLMFAQISDLGQKLQNIDMSIKSVANKVDRVESKLHATIRTVDTMATEVREIKQQVTNLENGLQYQSVSIDEQKVISAQHENKLKSMECCMNDCQRTETNLKEEILDLKTRSMRDNLVFYNIPEEANEDPEETLRYFCATKLDMKESINNIKIDRAHRMGKKYDNKCRPLVAKFNYFKDKEFIRSRANKLRGSRFGIAEQFPTEIRERRRLLLPVLKEAKEQGKRASLVVDKLYIEGRQYHKH